MRHQVALGLPAEFRSAFGGTVETLGAASLSPVYGSGDKGKFQMCQRMNGSGDYSGGWLYVTEFDCDDFEWRPFNGDGVEGIVKTKQTAIDTLDPDTLYPVPSLLNANTILEPELDDNLAWIIATMGFANDEAPWVLSYDTSCRKWHVVNQYNVITKPEEFQILDPAQSAGGHNPRGRPNTGGLGSYREDQTIRFFHQDWNGASGSSTRMRRYVWKGEITEDHFSCPGVIASYNLTPMR